MFDIHGRHTSLRTDDIIVWHKEHHAFIFGRPLADEKGSYTFLRLSKDEYDNEYPLECVKDDDDVFSVARLIATSHGRSVKKVQTKINPTYRVIAAP